jgi:hypothetical protein
MGDMGTLGVPGPVDDNKEEPVVKEASQSVILQSQPREDPE